MEEEADVRWPVPSPRRPRTLEAGTGSEGNGTARRGAGTWPRGSGAGSWATWDRAARRWRGRRHGGRGGPTRAGVRSGAGAAQPLWPMDGGVAHGGVGIGTSGADGSVWTGEWGRRG